MLRSTLLSDGWKERRPQGARFNVINRRSDSSGERGVVIRQPLPYRRLKEIHDEERRFPIEKPQKPH